MISKVRFDFGKKVVGLVFFFFFFFFYFFFLILSKMLKNIF